MRSRLVNPWVLTIAGLVILLLGGLLFVGIGPERLFLVRKYYEKSREIVFHGRVVDQQGDPIAGATVSILIQRPNLNALFGADKYLSDDTVSVTTNQDGSFALRGVNGLTLFV